MDIDLLQKGILESICNVQLSDLAWSQASLPVNMGGLGIRRFAKLAPSAFLASAAGTSELSQTIYSGSSANACCPIRTKALDLWSQDHSEQPPSEANSSKQKAWDRPIIESTFSSLMANCNPTSKARLLAAQRKESGAWLSAPPVTALGLRMDDESVRVAVGLRVSAPLCRPHQCVLCGNHVDSLGTHGLHCWKSVGRLPRHAALNNVVKSTLASIEVPSILEPTGLSRSDGKRVDGVTVIPWKSGRPLTWDVTCWDTFAPTYSSLAVSGAGLVANCAESRKKDLYRHLEPTHIFIPIGLETTGVFGNEALAFFKDLASRLRIRSNDSQSFLHLCQRISVIVQKFNAMSILGCSKLC